MGKGANKQLLNNSGTAQTRSQNLQTRSKNQYDFLEPQLEGEATNPQGYGAQGVANLNTATQQSEGGSTAGIVGESNLEAARTRNSGGYAGVASEAGRNAARDLSQKALEVQVQNANLKEAQKQQALASIQSLYGTNLSTALQYLNSSNSALNDENASHPLQSGFQTFADVLAGVGKAASGAADLEKACWIAAAVYDGWDDPRTIDVRRWLNTEFKQHLAGRVVMAVYLAIGRQVAAVITRVPVLKHPFKALFDIALRKARRHD